MGVETELRQISAEEFVKRLASRPEHTQHALLLGAGCSVSSDIPAAGTLVKSHWLPRLQKYRQAEGEDLDAWAEREIEGYDAKNPALSYGPVMEVVCPTEHDKQREVEQLCRGRDPGFGCCVLAKLIEREHPDFNVILTTNFDDLMADALYLFTASRPLVISHAALARFMLADPGRPLIAKLHGDYQLEPLNTEEELHELNTRVRERLKGLLQQRGLIVIGYGGNDESVMGALEALPDDALRPGVWWVSRSEPNERVRRWLDGRGLWVESPDFDQLMLLVQQEFKVAHPEIDRWRDVRSNYFEALDELRSDVDKLAQSDPSAPALKQASAQALDHIPGWWGVELQARQLKESEPDEAEVIYRRGLEQMPQSGELAASYALFLKNQRNDFGGAEELYRRALKLQPENAVSIGNYASLLTEMGKDTKRADRYHKRAMELRPREGDFAANYARHLIWTGRAQEALVYIDRGLELADPDGRAAAELWFYLYANGPSARWDEALGEERRLILAGTRSPGWDLSGNVKRAEEDGHPESRWLGRLAAVIAEETPAESLDDWEVWTRR